MWSRIHKVTGVAMSLALAVLLHTGLANGKNRFKVGPHHQPLKVTFEELVEPNDPASDATPTHQDAYYGVFIWEISLMHYPGTPLNFAFCWTGNGIVSHTSVETDSEFGKAKRYLYSTTEPKVIPFGPVVKENKLTLQRASSDDLQQQSDSKEGGERKLERTLSDPLRVGSPQGARSAGVHFRGILRKVSDTLLPGSGRSDDAYYFTTPEDSTVLSENDYQKYARSGAESSTPIEKNLTIQAKLTSTQFMGHILGGDPRKEFIVLAICDPSTKILDKKFGWVEIKHDAKLFL